MKLKNPLNNWYSYSILGCLITGVAWLGLKTDDPRTYEWFPVEVVSVSVSPTVTETVTKFRQTSFKDRERNYISFQVPGAGLPQQIYSGELNSAMLTLFNKGGKVEVGVFKRKNSVRQNVCTRCLRVTHTIQKY